MGATFLEALADCAELLAAPVGAPSTVVVQWQVRPGPPWLVALFRAATNNPTLTHQTKQPPTISD